MADSPVDLSKSQLFDTDGRTVFLPHQVPASASAASGAAAAAVGSIIDQKYKIIGLLGEGGMGAVYKAHHELLKKEVALKTFKSTSLTEDALKRFQREAQAIARLNHINIVPVFDFGVGENNVPYYTMECLSGQSLADRLTARGPLTVDQTAKIFIQVCRGLADAHSKGIVHRDLKPANIFLTNDLAPDKSPLVKLVDFGVAGWAQGSLEGQRLTSTGLIFGSPLYMSPEQSLGQQLTPATDLYSCACALYETLTGSPPFHGENAFATMLKHQSNRAPALAEKAPGIKFPGDLQTLLDNLLEKDPQARCQSAGEVAEALSKILAGQPIARLSGQKSGRGSSPVSQLEDSGEGPGASKSRGEEQTDQEEADTNAGQRNAGLVALAAVAVILISGTGLLWWHFSQPGAKTQAGEDQSTGIVSGAASAGIDSSASGTEPRIEGEKSESATVLTGKELAAIPISQYRQYGEIDGITYKPIGTVANMNHPRKMFVFPPGTDLGRFEIRKLPVSDQNRVNVSRASGSVLVPERAELRLIAGQQLCERPDLFDGFGPADLDAVEFEHSEMTDLKWGDKHMAKIAKLSLLPMLTISESGITDKSIDYINALHYLHGFDLNHVALNKSAIMKIQRLPQFTFLNLSGIKDLSGAFDKMANSTRASYLELNGCNLTNDDMKVFGTLPHLWKLMLNDNANITDSGVKSLVGLKYLGELGLSGTGVTPASIPILGQIHSLSNLYLDGSLWSAADVKQLRALLPHCNIRITNEVTAEEAATFVVDSQDKISTIKPFLKNQDATNQTERKFVFPEGGPLGELILRPGDKNKFADKYHLLYEGDSSTKLVAQGSVTVPPDMLIEFVASGRVANEPRLLNGFSADDLDRIRLGPVEAWHDRDLAYLSHLLSLKKVAFAENQFTGKHIESLNPLHDLLELDVRKTLLTGEDLAKIRRLPKLFSLQASGLKQMAPALEKLRNSQNISRLELANCDLTDADLETISTMKGLTTLMITDNKNVTDKGLAALAKLEGLGVLFIRNTSVTESCIESLKRMKSLNLLDLDHDGWSPEAQKRLAALPKVTLNKPRQSLDLGANQKRKDNPSASDLLDLVGGDKTK